MSDPIGAPTMRPYRRRLLALLGAAALSPLAGCVAAQDRADRAALPPLTAALLDGGNVVYFRHAATRWSGIDRIEWPRERQRLLSEEGVRQSEAIGAAFTAAGMPVGEVLASPFARCMDTARIAFGRAEPRPELLGLLSDDAGRAGRAASLARLLAAPPSPGTNRVIVSHRSNIAEAAGVALAEGEGVVIRPDGQGSFEVLGTAMPEEWVT